MAELIPYPFASLIRRMFSELERSRSVFDLAESKFVLGSDRDLSVRFHDRSAASPLGPAAGPQTQMAQNLVLSWLGGSRVMELKTVQVDDRLTIPRPCIDMKTVGLNIEWSQELTLEQSLEEYVKGAMLIEMLRAGPLATAAGFEEVIYDLSVGYDLEGIRSERVLAFMRGMIDASPTVEKLRSEIPDEYAHLRDLDYPTRLSDSVTLSTFHGCPPQEIEKIIEFLMREVGLHSVVKFNPMLLGPERTRAILHDELGYRDIEIPDSAFERDTTWEQAGEIMERLSASARALGLGLGAKFSNTLIVQNDAGFLSTEVEEAYLSGLPLHVLAMHLVRRFRRAFGDRFPISFAAGVDRLNFADCAALGLVPITVCSDLLKKGGYGRLTGYYVDLERRMDTAGARSLDELILRSGNGDEALKRLPDVDPTLRERCRLALAEGTDSEAAAGDLFASWVSEARILNTETYVEQLGSDARYRHERNSTPPRKIGSHLELFDCVTCDICVPVCPNDANFTFAPDLREIPVLRAEATETGWSWTEEASVALEQRHQIANFADFCNDCGNCDIFCPEDGGPYVVKPRFFGSEVSWRESRELDGFFVESGALGDRVLARFGAQEFEVAANGEDLRYSGAGFSVTLEASDPRGTLRGASEVPVDLTYCFIMDIVRRSVLDPSRANYVNSQAGEAAPQ